MTIYIVSMSTTQGPYGPSVEMSYHRDLAEADGAFFECQQNLTDDPSTILLIKLDVETMTETVLNSFEGTDEDYGDQYAQDIEDEGNDWIVEGRPEGGE